MRLCRSSLTPHPLSNTINARELFKLTGWESNKPGHFVRLTPDGTLNAEGKAHGIGDGMHRYVVLHGQWVRNAILHSFFYSSTWATEFSVEDPDDVRWHFIPAIEYAVSVCSLHRWRSFSF